MTTRSTLVDTVLMGSEDGSGMKRKLAIALLAIVGVSILLRTRKGDTEANETEERSTGDDESESTSESTATDESGASEPTASGESPTESATERQRELDMFDMLAIFAAAITSARDEYRKRAGN